MAGRARWSERLTSPLLRALPDIALVVAMTMAFPLCLERPPLGGGVALGHSECGWSFEYLQYARSVGNEHVVRNINAIERNGNVVDYCGQKWVF